MDVDKDVLSLPGGLLARYLHYTDLMLEFGPDPGMPHTRALGGGLFELRLRTGVGIGRVFYCTLVGKSIVMLPSFVKKTQKTPARELRKARSRLIGVKKDGS